MVRISSHGELYQKLILIVVALLLSSLELVIPRIPLLPWLKPGLANIVMIVWLYRFGYRDALLYGLLRIWFTVFFFGFSFFSAMLAGGGMITAVTAMAILMNINKKKAIFGTIGIGITGALFHNFGQLLVMKSLIGEASLYGLQIPIMSLLSLVTGSITGFLAFRFNKVEISSFSLTIDEVDVKKVPIKKSVLSVILFITMIASLFIDSIVEIGIYFCAIHIIALLVSKSIKKLFKNVYRFWMFLLVLFLSAGLISGWEEGTIQLIRVTTWLQCTLLFQFLQSDRLLFKVLQRFFPARESTLASALLAVEVFPIMLEKGIFQLIGHPIQLLKKPSLFLESLVNTGEKVVQEWSWSEKKEEQ